MKMVQNVKRSRNKHPSFRRKLVIMMKNAKKLNSKNIDKILTE